MRIRSIKPAFFHDEDLAELPALTRILFAGLWTLADGSGRCEYRPKYIKAQVLPYDQCDIEKMLADLERGEFIQIYEVENRQYIQIPNFSKHQRITGKEAEEGSTLPPPPKRRGNNGETLVKQSGNNGETPIVQEGKGREGKGMEVAPKNGAALVPEILKPETPLQVVIRGWKIQSGVDPEDKAWDAAHYKRHLRPAQALLNLFSGDIDAALDCIEVVYRNLVESKGLDLSLQGVVNNSGRFRQEWQERNAMKEVGRI